MRLEIKEPCSEVWSNMKIGILSRHCGVCAKGVIDFTKMNRAEIITYILLNQNDQVCGRMKPNQFDFLHDDIPILIETLKNQRTANPFLILALLCLSLASSAQEQQSSTINIKTPILPIENFVLGKVKPVEDTNYIKTVRDSIKEKSQINYNVTIIDPSTIEEMGEVVVLDKNNQGDLDSIFDSESQSMPEFVGGIDSLFQFLHKEIKYPRYAVKNQIQGNVYVRFIVEKDGRISNTKILRSPSEFFNDEVYRVINLMPNWIPAIHNGENVASPMVLPIRFSLK